MATRLTARISAGAALVTGIGMMGIVSAAPAAADVSANLDYTCSVSDLGIDFSDAWKVNMTVGVDEQVEPGAAIPEPAITAEVTPGADAHESMRDLGIKTLEGTADATYSFGDEGREAALTVDQVEVPDEGEVTTIATGTGQAETAPAEDSTVDITAGDFTAALTTDTGFVLNLACAAPDDAVIGSIQVGEAEAPEADDWFTEPQGLPITEDGKHFTVEGAATRDGVLNVALLDENKNVLETTPWNVTEGDNSKDFPFADGTDYVRLISEDCVDADGNDETVLGSSCNVEYYAPWVAPGDDNDTDAPGDDSADEPEIPGVVQTDGFTQSAKPEFDNTVGLALGGMLLASAGVVVVARRRIGQH